MEPGEFSRARPKRIDGEAVAHDKEATLVPVQRARLVVDRGCKSHRPGTTRMLHAHLHAAESIRIWLRTCAERAVIGERCPRLREGENGGRLTAAPPGGANTQASGETCNQAARLSSAGRDWGGGAVVHSTILRASYDEPMKAILFDWDGTLIDTAEHVFQANVEVIKSIGLPPLSRELYGLHYSPNWRRMYTALGVPEPLVEGAAEIWHGAYRGHEADLLPGARAALERLVAAGIPIGVVTAGDRKVVSGQLKRTGVADLLGSVVYGDDITEQKPHPEPLRRGLAALGHGSTPDLAAYLGDTLDDVRMARAAGLRAIGVQSPFFDPERFLAEADAHEHAESVAAWVDAYLAARTR
jgi:phosphoglycolate phosphatase